MLLRGSMSLKLGDLCIHCGSSVRRERGVRLVDVLQVRERLDLLWRQAGHVEAASSQQFRCGPHCLRGRGYWLSSSCLLYRGGRCAGNRSSDLRVRKSSLA